MSEELQHLWIPDEEVEQLDKKLRGDSEDRGLDHSAHGETLSTGLRNIVTAYSHLENDSLSDEDIMIFKMVLPETEEIYSKRDIAEKKGSRSTLSKISTAQLFPRIRRCLLGCRSASESIVRPEG